MSTTATIGGSGPTIAAPPQQPVQAQAVPTKHIIAFFFIMTFYFFSLSFILLFVLANNFLSIRT